MSAIAQAIATQGDEMPQHEERGAADAAVIEIAKRVLHVDTLEAQNTDALDFHELAVWSIREALLAAYAAGASTRS